MSNTKEAIEAVFFDVEKILRRRIGVEKGFSRSMDMPQQSRLTYSYSVDLCKVILADVEKIKIKHTVNAEKADVERSEGEKVSVPGFKALLTQRIEASPLFKNFGEDGLFIQDFVTELIANMPECDVPGVIICRECKNGQQCGELGVVCKYSQDEYLPYEHFCARGERRTFDDEGDEE